jgi:hypothetical protein
MGINAILGAASYVPATIIQKALGKLDPRFNGYFSKALSYGIDIDRSVNYLADKFEDDSTKNYKYRLKEKGAIGTLRPDQAVSKSQIENSEIPGKALKAIASYGTGAALALPGKQEKQQSGSPLSVQNMEEDVQSQNQPQEETRSDNSDKVIQYIQKRMNDGMNLEEAVDKARSSEFWKPIVRKIEGSGIDLLDWAKEKLGMSQGASQDQFEDASGMVQGQSQGQQGGSKRDQIMQMGNQIAQTLAGLKR